MSHSHEEHNHHSHSHHCHAHHTAHGNIKIAFFLNSIFVVIEIIGGILTNSVAILSDAMHDLGDSLSLAIAWFLQKKSTQQRDEAYPYGYKRFSLLGSLFLSIVLLLSSIFILSEALGRIIDPQPVDAKGMLWLAIIGILVNGAAALRVKTGTSINERAVYLHILEDVLGWIAVLIVSIVMMFVNLPILDPLLSIGISLWVLSNVYKNLKATLKVFLQATPEDLSNEQIKSKLLRIEGVNSIHDLHLWSLDGESHVMTLHVEAPDYLYDTIKHKIHTMGEQYHIIHTTIEFEPLGYACSAKQQ